MSPGDTWWGNLVPDIRYMLIAGTVAVISLFIHGASNDGIKFSKIGFSRILIAFIINLAFINMWAVEPEEHLEGFILYAKHFVVMYLIYRISINTEMIKMILLVTVVGCLWFGFQAYGKSGRLEGVAGAINNANTLGMQMSTGVLVAGMMFMGFKGHFKWIPFFSIPLILNTVVLSGSRGAFLGLVTGGLAAAYFCPPRFRAQFGVLSVLAVVLFFMVAHEQFLERIASIFLIKEGTEAADTSAGGRLEIAGYGWEMAKDYPLGAGHKGTRSLSPGYIPAHLLSKGRRSAHNSVMAALVSYGFIGAALYLALYAWAAKQLFRLRRFAVRTDDSDLHILVAIYGSVLGIVFVSGMFSNYVFAEVQFWIFALLGATLNVPEVRERVVQQSTNTRSRQKSYNGGRRTV